MGPAGKVAEVGSCEGHRCLALRLGVPSAAQRAPRGWARPPAAWCLPPSRLPSARTSPVPAQAVLVGSGFHGPGPRSHSYPLGVTAPLQSQAQASAKGQRGVCPPARVTGLSESRGGRSSQARPVAEEGYLQGRPSCEPRNCRGVAAAWPACGLANGSAAGPLHRAGQPGRHGQGAGAAGPGTEALLSEPAPFPWLFRGCLLRSADALPSQPAGGAPSSTAPSGFLEPASPIPPCGLRFPPRGPLPAL